MFRFFTRTSRLLQRTAIPSLSTLTSFRPLFLQPMVSKRSINNQKVYEELLGNPGKTLSEIHRAREWADKYISIENYQSLSEEDRKSLNDVLFTHTGFYALYMKYVTVEQFLALPLEARKLLSKLFWDAGEEYWSAQNDRENIDLVFAGNYLNLKQFSVLPHHERKALMDFLTLRAGYGFVGIDALQEHCFTVDDYISYTPEQKHKMIELLIRVEDSGRGPTSPLTYQKIMSEARKLAESFKLEMTPSFRN